MPLQNMTHDPLPSYALPAACQFTTRIAPISGITYSDVTALKVVDVNKPADGSTFYIRPWSEAGHRSGKHAGYRDRHLPASIARKKPTVGTRISQPMKLFIVA